MAALVLLAISAILAAVIVLHHDNLVLLGLVVLVACVVFMLDLQLAMWALAEIGLPKLKPVEPVPGKS